MNLQEKRRSLGVLLLILCLSIGTLGLAGCPGEFDDVDFFDPDDWDDFEDVDDFDDIDFGAAGKYFNAMWEDRLVWV